MPIERVGNSRPHAIIPAFPRPAHLWLAMFVLLFSGTALRFEGDVAELIAVCGEGDSAALADAVDDWEAQVREEFGEPQPFAEALMVERDARHTWWKDGAEPLTVFATPRKPYLWMAWSVSLGEGERAVLRRVAAFATEEHMLASAPYRERGVSGPGQPLSGEARIDYYRRIVEGGEEAAAKDAAALPESGLRLEAIGCAGVRAVRVCGEGVRLAEEGLHQT
jgi:hypothetical protein